MGLAAPVALFVVSKIASSVRARRRRTVVDPSSRVGDGVAAEHEARSHPGHI
jgi:hypothetical protein